MSASASSPPAERPGLSDLLADSRIALAAADHRRGLALAQQAAGHEDGGPRERAHALTLQGHHFWRLGRFEEAVMTARSAVPLWQALRDVPGEADALCLLAVACTELGLHEEGLRHATAAFELARHHGVERAATLALNRIGVCHERLGDPEQGERFLLQALARSREQREFDDTLQALNNLMANTLSAHHLHLRRGDEPAARQALALTPSAA